MILMDDVYELLLSDNGIVCDCGVRNILTLIATFVLLLWVVPVNMSAKYV